ncbi:MAG: bifunctional phosphoribosylaminoimidazolecarboxamide formyltransferase/inosine monophosphate cyclohydrolase [Candidatus Omnitrophica bacterium CG07_land_8_20_14_0_80_50_8]|nr:MAG: bifunctional phosphoribosylaminoimidazolecarboxamide formyltransferase/inosine monophosphate cyclohydrolase [Candidatus Omnitrophica bacterium CG07_land_8_20_14_0_80_50_8]
MNQIKRALISVYDKTGIVPFAKALDRLGIQIVSTGGSAQALRKAGVPVTEVSAITKFPEMLDGRVKTLHPNIHAGLLALRDKPEHMQTLEKHRIRPIDLLVVNLYPFWDALKTKTRPEEIIEMIDIGGPAMLRSAAKNFKAVAALSDPGDYEMILRELKKNDACLPETLLRTLAAKVFKLTAYYDGLIYRYFEGKVSSKEALPERLTLDFEKITDLRYGENPHQKGALYSEKGAKAAGIVKAKQLHGKELSFNNILDLDAALEMAEAFEGSACAIVKHTNPCGFAIGRDAKSAFRSAYQCDPLSAFGSIIGFNTLVDGKAAKAMLDSGFIECVIAHGFSKEALELLKVKKNMRLLTVASAHDPETLDFKKVSGGLLLQDRDRKDPSAAALRCVTKTSPKDSEIRDLLFAFKVCRYVKSNAIVIAKQGVTLGLGMGQPSRVDSCDTAFKKAGRRARGAVLASDGFFPKPDSIGLAKKFGISAIIQPGGSILDETVIKACNQAKMSMVFTGVRHFKH